MAEYYIMKVCAGITAGSITLGVLTLIALFLSSVDIIDSCDGVGKVFKLIFTLSGIVAVVVPFFVENAEYHIIHNGRNYFTNEIIYLKDGGIHFQSGHVFEGSCITINDDYIINKI